MSIQIPIPRQAGESFLDLSVTLDGFQVTLEFRWNVRLGAWFMNVLDPSSGAVHSAGIRLVSDWPLPKYQTDRTPPGVFFLVDTARQAGNGTEPQLDDLGVRHLLYYALGNEARKLTG